MATALQVAVGSAAMLRRSFRFAEEESPEQMTIELGSIVKGTVVSIADYGAIVRLGGGKTGLIHISEIADAFVRDVRDYLSEDVEVEVKVLRVNEKGRYELSLKQCRMDLASAREPRQLAPAAVSAKDSPSPSCAPVTFEDKLSRFLRDSEQRQHDLKRHTDTRRGRR